MPNKSKKTYSEIDHIREDLDSLKNNVVELTRHMKKDGNAQAAHLRENLAERMEYLQKAGRGRYQQLEGRVKEKPGQSLAMAFGAGILASMLLGRR